MTRLFSLGWLVLAAVLTGGPVSGADVYYFGMIKSQHFVQTSAAAPILAATNAFVFNAFVVATTNNLVTNATVKPPFSTTTPIRTLLLQPGGASLQFEEHFNSQSALDTAYPTGSPFNVPSYSFAMFCLHDGARTTGLGFGLGFTPGNYPATPQISNFSTTQAIDSTASFKLLWSLVGGQSSDVVQVTVSDAASNILFSSPAPFSTNALTGISNSMVIPGYTLPPGSNLTAHLSVARPAGFNTNAYPGAVGVSGLAMDVRFPIVTRPAPVLPRLSLSSANTKPFRLQFNGETNRNYHIQATTNFISWRDLLVTNSPTGLGAFTDTNSVGLSKRFYRIQVGP
ncbi:MAG: hypothetical protein JWR69_2693 [Pedosphaera sp.]|nr:hypothetical protein [Pedosphaera sp.]